MKNSKSYIWFGVVAIFLFIIWFFGLIPIFERQFDKRATELYKLELNHEIISCYSTKSGAKVKLKNREDIYAFISRRLSDGHGGVFCRDVSIGDIFYKELESDTILLKKVSGEVISYKFYVPKSVLNQ